MQLMLPREPLLVKSAPAGSVSGGLILTGVKKLVQFE